MAHADPNASGSNTYTKPQPVVILGLVITFLVALVSGLLLTFKDNPTVVLVLGIVSVVITALNAVKDQYLKSLVTPYSDTATYIDQTGQLVAGPASPLPIGTAIQEGGDVPLGEDHSGFEKDPEDVVQINPDDPRAY